MITTQTRREVFERQGYKCAHPHCGMHFEINEPQGSPFAGHLHHVYFKSEYKRSDRDEAWNLALLCPDHHEGQNGIGVHGGNTWLRNYLRCLADIHKRPEDRSKTTIAKVKIRKSKIKIEKKPVSIEQKIANRLAQKKIRDKSLERYKSDHNGLSPWQVNYKKQKAYLAQRKRQNDDAKKEME